MATAGDKAAKAAAQAAGTGQEEPTGTGQEQVDGQPTGTGQEAAGQPAESKDTPAGSSRQLVVVSGDSPFSGIDLSEFGFNEEDLKNLTGMDSMSMTDIRIPYGQLISKPTRDYRLGDIVLPDGTVLHGAEGGAIESMSVLRVGNVRVMFPSPFDPNNDYICRSIDGVEGHTDGAYPGRPCSTCEFAVYPEAGGASPCRDQRLLLCAMPDGAMFFLQIGGVNIRPFKTFFSTIMNLMPKVRNIWGAFDIRTEVKMEDTKFGPFPYFDFRVNREAPFVDQNRLITNLSSYKAFKDFEQMHLETAANQAKVGMAVGEAESEGTAQGQNTKLF